MSKSEMSTDRHYTKVPTDESKKEPDIIISEVPSTYGYGIRHIQLALLFFTTVISFITRGHMGVTLVAMTDHSDIATANDHEAHHNQTIVCQNATFGPNVTCVKPYEEIRNMELADFDEANMTDKIGNVSRKLDFNEEARSLYSTFSWTKPIQEMVLTSFFVSYCLMMLPIALVCQRWGGKVPLQLSMLVNGVVSILTPWLAHWGGWKAICVCRLLQGFAQAGTYPGLQTLLAQWVPDCEKGTLTSYVYTGATTGSVLGFQVSGVLSQYFGWPAPFWAIGMLCLVMFVLLTVLAAKSPRVHATISEEEKMFIVSQTQATSIKPRKAPWKALFTNKPLLASYATATGSGACFVFFFTQVPSYLHYIYGLDVKNSGLLSSLPYIFGFFASLSCGILSDYLINNNYVTKKNARRYFNLFAQIGMGSALIGASYASNTTVAVVWFVVFMVTHMATHTGWMLNQIDLAPNYSGTMIAISNAFANGVVMVMPLLISHVITDLENVFQWRVMLFLEAGLAVVPGVIFAIFISVDVQPWNDGDVAGEEIESTNLEFLEKNEEKK